MFDGRRLREIRLEKNLSLQEISNISEVSVGMISQIERNKSDPTMTTLYKLCQGLDITIASLFAETEESNRVVRKENRKTMMLPNSKVKYQLLTPNLKTDLEMLLIELDPGQEDRKQIMHHGEECGFVIQGQLTVILGEEEYLLNTGDSIHFKSTILHRFMNNTDKPSISLWAMTPASF